jgi:glycerophosphoryl diester phosphodiesterase
MPRRARENSLGGFALALEAGAQGIELDVHATADGVVVVHHDPILAGGAGIAALTHDWLRTLESAPGVPVPTLREVCDLVGRRAELFVEIKGAGIERLVLDALRDRRGETAIHSFDHDMIARLHRSACPWPLGILVEEAPADVAAAMRRTGASDLWPHWSVATPALVGAAHAVGARVIAWTVNDVVVAEELRAAGIDGICTDDVSLLPP